MKLTPEQLGEILGESLSIHGQHEITPEVVETAVELINKLIEEKTA